MELHIGNKYRAIVNTVDFDDCWFRISLMSLLATINNYIFSLKHGKTKNVWGYVTRAIL